jgi:hypothetical protein
MTAETAGLPRMDNEELIIENWRLLVHYSFSILYYQLISHISSLGTLRKRVGKVPTDPGVYRWLDKDGRLLYIDKPKTLRGQR